MRTFHSPYPLFSLAIITAITTAAMGGCGDSAGPADGDLGCNPNTGLRSPLQVCSQAYPCTRPAPETGLTVITSSSDTPVCETTVADRSIFNDGPPISWTDAQGIARYHCLYRNPNAVSSATLPLVVWLHGGGKGAASDLYDYTNIRQKALTFNLTGDAGRVGFHVISLQGRNLHYFTLADRDGHHHDFYYRDLSSPSTNPDIAAIDRAIDEFVATGVVDPARIYMMGWSNGGFFSQLYAIARHVRATPGGNRVAGAAVYTAADPFNNIHPTQSPSCALDPYPTSTVPIFLISRACDIVACDQAQADAFALAGTIVEPGHIVAPWLEDLQNRIGDHNVERRIVAGNGSTVTSCSSASLCSAGLGLLNHLRWPDGVRDGSGIDHEPAMLEFLRANPLP